jgi:rhodanese-related sulfurtransferase
MTVIPFVHEGLGNSSYLVELPDGAAALVDPDRTAQRYLRAAEERGLRITTVLETHLHADFVTGAKEVAHALGARIFLPEGAGSRYEHDALRAGERLRLGGVEVEAVGSPGHTTEHLSYALRRAGGPPVLFSGGSLIVGGAARTDLIAPDQTEALTRAQYRTLRGSFTTLPDETLLYPTHGVGSFCSAGAGGDRTSTLGRERARNPLLSLEDEEEFVRWFPTTFPAVPAYYARMRAFNRAGPRLRREIAEPPALDAGAFDRAQESSTLIDLRSVDDYATAHIPGSLHIPLRDAYPVWLGWLVPEDSPLLFVLDDKPMERVIDESLLVGYEGFAGWLEGGVEAWARGGKPIRRTELVDVDEARRLLRAGAVALDVREPAEYAAGRIDGAVHAPLGELLQHLERIPRDRPVVAYCGHGFRGSTAASLAERAGFQRVVNLRGGFEAWERAGALAARG